jgi:hypothetical protein
MSFLFRSKKQQSNTPSPAPTRDVLSSGLDSNSSLPTTNGSTLGKEKEKLDQASTPGSSVNNSLNSLGGAGTPSPEQKGLRTVEGDAQVGIQVIVDWPMTTITIMTNLCSR